MAKKKVEEEAPAEPEEEAEGEEAAAAPEKVSKMEAVRRILADDPETKPTEGIEAIKRLHGLEMSTGNFSAYKSQIKAAAAKTAPAKPAGKPKAAAAAPVAALAPAKPAGMGLAETMAALQQIVKEHGAEEVKKLVDLFGQDRQG